VPKDAGAAALGEDVEADMERVRAEIEAYDARRELVRPPPPPHPPRRLSSTRSSTARSTVVCVCVCVCVCVQVCRPCVVVCDASGAPPQVIKGTRDVQKAAKQAIFSLHRGDTAGAGKKLKDAHDAALAIKRDHLDELPTLRQVRSAIPRDPCPSPPPRLWFSRNTRLLACALSGNKRAYHIHTLRWYRSSLDRG
jgi:hypothetical protein